ncbi:MAG: hypothetical protein ACSW76_00350 [Bacteroidaceae bacterium]
MESLYNLVLKKKQEVSQISCNPTLGAMDLLYCKILDDLVATDAFVAGRVDSCIKELSLAGGIDFNGHYLTAFDMYNEAVTYYDLQQRGFKVHNIPETTTPTPDFEVEFTYRDWDGTQVAENVFIEVKSLAFANGSQEYKKAQAAAFECNVHLEEQRERGRRFCTSEYCVSPLGEKDNGPTFEIEEFNKKISNNIKVSQFKYGNGEDTILFVDMSQYMFPFKEEECLPIYPNILRHYSTSGRLWMIAFGINGERIFTWPEFEGKGNFDRLLERPGILNSHDYIKGIVFCTGSEKGKRKLYGLYRYEEEELKTSNFICQVCDFVNDDKNTNGYKFFLKLEEDLKKRYGVSK